MVKAASLHDTTPHHADVHASHTRPLRQQELHMPHVPELPLARINSVLHHCPQKVIRKSCASQLSYVMGLCRT